MQVDGCGVCTIGDIMTTVGESIFERPFVRDIFVSGDANGRYANELFDLLVDQYVADRPIVTWSGVAEYVGRQTKGLSSGFEFKSISAALEEREYYGRTTREGNRVWVRKDIDVSVDAEH